MNESRENTICRDTRVLQRRPVFTVIALVFIPIAYWLGFGVVRENAVPDFLGYDIGRAVSRFHFPASILGLGVLVTAFLRRERPRIVVILLGIATGAWFAFALYFILHALPFLP